MNFRPKQYLLAILAFGILLRILLYSGFLGSDDISTFHLAVALSNGELAPVNFLQNPIASLRYGLAVPLGVILAIAGTGEFPALLIPILFSLLAIVLIWKIVFFLTRSQGAAAFAAFLQSFNSMDIQQSTTFMPDAPMLTVSLLALWCVLRSLPEYRLYRKSNIGQIQQIWLPKFLGNFLDDSSLPNESMSWKWLLFAGLFSGIAVSFKISAIQVMLSFSLVLFYFFIKGKFRREFLAIPAGFFFVLFSELVLMKFAHGSFFYRYSVIFERSASNSNRRGQDSSFFERVASDFSRLLSEQPAFGIIVLFSILLLLYFLYQWYRSVGWRDSVTFFMAFGLCHFLLRLPEILNTYSYQPRRLMPFAAWGIMAFAIFLFSLHTMFLSSSLKASSLGIEVERALVLSRRNKHRQRLMRFSVVTLATLLAVFLLKDSIYQRAYRSRIDPERWVYEWVAQRDVEAANSYPLYVDHRTYKTLYALNGMESIEDLGVELLPSPVGQKHSYFGARPLAFKEGAFFFENSRVLDWLARSHHDRDYFSCYADMPSTWRMQKVIEHPGSNQFHSALYLITSKADFKPAFDSKPRVDSRFKRIGKEQPFQLASVNWQGLKEEITHEIAKQQIEKKRQKRKRKEVRIGPDQWHISRLENCSLVVKKNSETGNENFENSSDRISLLLSGGARLIFEGPLTWGDNLSVEHLPIFEKYRDFRLVLEGERTSLASKVPTISVSLISRSPIEFDYFSSLARRNQGLYGNKAQVRLFCSEVKARKSWNKLVQSVFRSYTPHEAARWPLKILVEIRLPSTSENVEVELRGGVLSALPEEGLLKALPDGQMPK